MIRIKSNFEENFPKKYTCDGENVSPPLEWSSDPGCKGFALIMEDPDAPSGNFVHWVLYNIPPTVNRLTEGLPAKPALEGIGSQGRNDFGSIGYGGPCPPRGHGPHRYYIRLYALRQSTDYEPGLSARELRQRIRQTVLGTTEFVARYSRS